MAFWITDGLLRKYEEEEGVTQVVIPDGVTEIGESAFENCRNLVSVRFSEHTKNGGSAEMQTMLMKYKSEVNGYKDAKNMFKL